MTDYEKYLFDLNGYLVIEDILSDEQVAALNAAVDNNVAAPTEPPATGLNSGSEKLSGTHGRTTFGGCLDWPSPWCEPFRQLMVLPAALRYMVETIGDDLRFEGLTGIANTRGSEGQILHGGGVGHSPDLEQGFFHRVEQGRMRNGLMAIAYLLSDVGRESSEVSSALFTASQNDPAEVVRLGTVGSGQPRHWLRSFYERRH